MLLTFQKQLGKLPHVVRSLIDEHVCWQIIVLALHVHVGSPPQSVAVARWLHCSPHPPVAVTLQSGRLWHMAPTNGHCVWHELCATDHWHVAEVWHSAIGSVLQFAWQMLFTLSHEH
jgi:hypothetical protein